MFINLYAFIALIAISIKVEKISNFGSSPPIQINPSSTYHTENHQIFLFGGELVGNSGYSSSLYLFDLNSSTWEEEIPSTSTIPESLSLSKSFFQSPSKFLVFFGKSTKGISSEIYSFDLETMTWSTSSFSGDPIKSSIRGGSCLFEYNSIQYFAVFGGITTTGVSEDLYLINTATLDVKLMSSQGSSPGKQAYGSLVYYEDFLYYFGLNEELNQLMFYKYSLDEETWYRVESNTENISGRNGHCSFVYEGKLYIYFGYDYSRTFENWQAFDFNTSQWETGTEEFESTKDFTCLFIDPKVYIICGTNSNGYNNEIAAFTPGASDKTVIVPKIMTPPKRANHAYFTFKSQIFIFGGSSDGKYFNDMWKFDTLNNEWSEIKMEGIIPPPRDKMSFHDLKGVGVVIYGGRTDTVVYDDYYHFAPEHLSWTLLTFVEGSEIIPKYSSCLIYDELIITLIGGQDYSRAYGDFWKFDYFYNRSINVDTDGQAILEVSKHCCWKYWVGSQYFLYVFGGTDYFQIPNNNIYKIEVLNRNSDAITYKIVKSIENNYVSVSLATNVVDGDYVFIIGGVYWGEKANEYLYVFDLSTDTLYKDSYLGDLSLIGHTSAQIGNSIYIFGGLRVKDGYQISSIGTNTLYKLSFDSNDKFSFSCSGGQFIDGLCVLCEGGYYSENNTCIPCPIGKFSKGVGARVIGECLPCRSGEFNDKPGSSYCKMCPSDKYCPVGAKYYLDNKESLVAEEQNFQGFERNTDYIDNIIRLSTYALIGLFIVLLISMLLIKDIKNLYENFDFLVDKHPQRLKFPVIYRKTPLGGLFSIIFILFAIATISTSIISFTSDNVIESQALIPKSAYNGEISADFIEFSFKLHIFGGTCVVNDKCHNSISLTQSDLIYKTRELICVQDNSNCIIKLRFTGFEINKDSSLNLVIFEAIAYCNIIGLNISVTSSIPNELSQVFIPLYPPSASELFKGSGPNKFFVEMIPSIFVSESSKWPQKATGYQLQNLNNHQVGSTVTYQTYAVLRYNKVAGLNVQVNLQVSTTILMTKRTLNLSTSLFFGTLIGSVFGLLGIFSTILTYFESIEEIVKNRKSKKFNVEKIKNQRKIIVENFEYETETKNLDIGSNTII